jgi:hypothetical protein
VKGLLFGTNCDQIHFVPVPFDIGTYAPYTIDDLAINYWVQTHLVAGQTFVRVLDHYRHHIVTFPSLTKCLLPDEYSVFICDPLCSSPNLLLARQLQCQHSPDFHGDLLVIKHAKDCPKSVVDVEERDLALINLLITW